MNISAENGFLPVTSGARDFQFTSTPPAGQRRGARRPQSADMPWSDKGKLQKKALKNSRLKFHFLDKSSKFQKCVLPRIALWLFPFKAELILNSYQENETLNGSQYKLLKKPELYT